METMMPTSFIPKRPVSSEPVPPTRQSHSVGILSLLAGVVVVVTIVSYAGVYLYQKQLLAQKAKTDILINKAREGIGSEFLSDMKRLNTRIDAVKVIIGKHIVVTPIFAALEQTTLHSIQYNSFSYSFTSETPGDATMVEVTVTGTAKSYATIALQSDAFTQNTLIKNPVFSNLTVDEKTSAVGFRLVFDVDPTALSYESFIAGLANGGGASTSTGTPITSTVQ
jgi:hypothetical protein